MEEELAKITKRMNTLEMKVFTLTMIVAFLSAFVLGILSTHWF